MLLFKGCVFPATFNCLCQDRVGFNQGQGFPEKNIEEREGEVADKMQEDASNDGQGL